MKDAVIFEESFIVDILRHAPQLKSQCAQANTPNEKIKDSNLLLLGGGILGLLLALFLYRSSQRIGWTNRRAP